LLLADEEAIFPVFELSEDDPVARRKTLLRVGCDVLHDLELIVDLTEPWRNSFV
jgi:hypothetical protein